MHHGMLTVYKEAGYTSSDAVARLRGILRMRKIGHTGTLDPDAEGVLPMCLGNATRICELIADREKEYLAVMRLGILTDTQDMSGEVLHRVPDRDIPQILLDPCRRGIIDDISQLPETIDGTAEQEEKPVSGTPLSVEKQEEKPVSGTPLAVEEQEEKSVSGIPLSEEEQERIADLIRRTAADFIGQIDQIPPMYSAIKVNGKRLYDMARKGITVERKPRRITIHSLDVEKIELPFVTMRVRCSKGTYIRTLCEDMGKALGTGAAMQSLLRTRVGQFTLQEAKTLDELERLAKTEPDKLLPLIRPVDSFFADLPGAACTEEALRLLKNGNVLTADQFRFLADREDPQKVYRSGKAFDLLSLPGINPGETVIRMYDAEGYFYGLYRTRPVLKGGKRYSAYKMFLPEK